jgi:hypothetical protein
MWHCNLYSLQNYCLLEEKKINKNKNSTLKLREVVRALVAVTLYWFPSLYLGKIS